MSSTGGNPEIQRRTFLTAGAGAVLAILTGCADSDDDDEAAPAPTTPTEATTTTESSDERVLIIGAGPAGMTAAHLLRQRGVDATVLEAAGQHGGRIKQDLTFADFPLSLGGEWIHVEASILDEAVNDPAADLATPVVNYQPDDQVGIFSDGQLALFPVGETPDLKFVGSSWLDFFNRNIVPGIEDLFVFDTVIANIDYSGDVVQLTDTTGTSYEADQVIVTVPLRMLQVGAVTFTPSLPDERLEAIEEATVWSGLKAFIQFDEAFYPTFLSSPEDESPDSQRLFYDAAYGQDSDANILGLFSVGTAAERYLAMTDDDLLSDILAELDAVFDGAASATYVKHIVQRWDDEPYAQGAYLEDDAPTSITRRLAPPLNDKLYFAGDAYTSFDDWSSVHTAVRSAAEAVDNLLG